MQLPWDEHFYEIVIPAWQAYIGAENRLTHAINARDVQETKRAGYDSLREGGAATIYLHHFAEVVRRARPDWLPRGIRSPGELRRWVSGYCTMLRSDRHVADVELCGDLADALKHAILTRNVDARQIRENDAVLALSTGYGELSFGEGKYGGTQQVIVLANSGARTSSATQEQDRCLCFLGDWKAFGAHFTLFTLDLAMSKHFRFDASTPAVTPGRRHKRGLTGFRAPVLAQPS